jgi:hypothetical protein
MRRHAVHIRSRRRLIDIRGDAEEEVGERMARTAGLDVVVEPKYSEVVRAGEVDRARPIEPLDVEAALYRMPSRQPGDSVGNLPVVLCQRLFLALAKVRVAGDLDRRRTGHVGRIRRQQRQAERADEVQAALPGREGLIGRRHAEANLIEKGRAKGVVVGNDQRVVRPFIGAWPETLVRRRRQRLDFLPAQTTEHRVAGAEVLIDPDVELVRDLGSLNRIAVDRRSLVGRRNVILQKLCRDAIDSP